MDLAPMLPCVINMFNRAISLSLLLIFSSSLAWLVLRAFISILEQEEQFLLVEALESNLADGVTLVLSQRLLKLASRVLYFSVKHERLD
jgi:hypothetical protein